VFGILALTLLAALPVGKHWPVGAVQLSFTDLVDTDADGRSADLPCPWCGGPTAETDTECVTCGQHFG
jgi:hypothetical protein